MKPPRNAGLYRPYKYCHSEQGVAKTELIQNWFGAGLEINLILFLSIVCRRLGLPYGLSHIDFDGLNTGINGSNTVLLCCVVFSV